MLGLLLWPLQVWQDALAAKASAPYLVHEPAGGPLQQLAFCPYEDVLAAGTSGALPVHLRMPHSHGSLRTTECNAGSSSTDTVSDSCCGGRTWESPAATQSLVLRP